MKLEKITTNIVREIRTQRSQEYLVAFQNSIRQREDLPERTIRRYVIIVNNRMEELKYS